MIYYQHLKVMPSLDRYWTVTETVPVAAPTVAVMVKAPVVPLKNETVATPPVVVADELGRVPPVPLVIAKLIAVPSATLLPSGFLTVAVMVAGWLLMAVIGFGDAVSVTVSLKTTTALPEVLPVEAVTVKLPASALVRVTVAIPPDVGALERERLPPVVEKETDVPSATGLPLVFLTVADIVTELLEAGVCVTVTDAGASGSVSGSQSTPQPAISIVHTAKRQTTLCMTPP